MIIGSKYIFIENLPSTNTYAAGSLKENKLQEGTIFRTNFQSAGRGQSGNYWESEKDMNLLISIILYPSTIIPSEQFILSMAISLGICDFLKRHIGVCSIKWPNDIYVNNDKIAGILIENSVLGESIEYSIAGIGLNINQSEFKSKAPNPISMINLTGIIYNLDDCLNQLAADLDYRYKQVISEKFDTIRNDYLAKMYRFNELSEFHDKKGSFSGKIISVDNDGRLLIERKSGKPGRYYFKEIEFIV